MMTPAVYQAIAIARALELYAKTGMKVNTAYTPKNMRAMAEKITGQKFKARDYLGMASALRAHVGSLSADPKDNDE